MCITDFLENGHIFGELEKKFFSLRLLTNVIEYSEEFILECWDRGFCSDGRNFERFNRKNKVFSFFRGRSFFENCTRKKL